MGVCDVLTVLPYALERSLAGNRRLGSKGRFLSWLLPWRGSWLSGGASACSSTSFRGSTTTPVAALDRRRLGEADEERRSRSYAEPGALSARSSSSSSSGRRQAGPRAASPRSDAAKRRGLGWGEQLSQRREERTRANCIFERPPPAAPTRPPRTAGTPPPPTAASRRRHPPPRGRGRRPASRGRQRTCSEAATASAALARAASPPTMRAADDGGAAPTLGDAAGEVRLRAAPTQVLDRVAAAEGARSASASASNVDEAPRARPRAAAAARRGGARTRAASTRSIRCRRPRADLGRGAHRPRAARPARRDVSVDGGEELEAVLRAARVAPDAQPMLVRDGRVEGRGGAVAGAVGHRTRARARAPPAARRPASRSPSAHLDRLRAAALGLAPPPRSPRRAAAAVHGVVGGGRRRHNLTAGDATPTTARARRTRAAAPEAWRASG